MYVRAARGARCMERNQWGLGRGTGAACGGRSALLDRAKDRGRWAARPRPPPTGDRGRDGGLDARRTARGKVCGGGSFILLLSICASRDLLGSKVSIGLRRHRSGGHVTAACPQQGFVGALGQKEDAAPSFVSAIVIDLSQH